MPNTVETKTKRTKTGGKTKQGLNRIDSIIKVPDSDKGNIARFRDYLNNPLTRDNALDMLVWLDEIALERKEPINFWKEANQN